MSLDAHKVFNGSTTPPDYIKGLTVAKKTADGLRSARDDIREALRQGLKDWGSSVTKRDLFEDALKKVEPPALRPKFRMQGSFAYHTCNAPAQCPPQEIDLDDGLFLPVSFLNGNGDRRPAVISAGLFLAVERILERLCERRGWTLNKDKDSCVRVELANDAHIDIALYAVPDATYAELLEKAARASGPLVADQIYRELQDSRDLLDEVYRDLPSDQIMLAHRRDGWKPSDPRKLEDWFDRAVETHGEQLRRVCRYLKGWRDHRWAKCRLASIAVMSAVVTAFDEAHERVPAHRDDLALLMVAERLPDILSDVIANPVVDGQRLDEGWTSEQRAEFVAEAESLVEDLQEALLVADDPDVAIERLIGVFGDRIPADPDLITQESERAPNVKSTVAAPAVLRHGRSDAAIALAVAALSEEEQHRRAEAAVQEAEARGHTSKPWFHD